MTKEEFKREYLTDAFFFVTNEEQFIKLQEIGVEFGLKNPIGGTDYIDYELKQFNLGPAKNLTFFPGGFFQQSDLWLPNASYGEYKNYEQFLKDYANLK